MKATIVLFVSTLVLASCRHVAGIDDKSAADSCGAAPERSAGCSECMGIHCCAELAACADDPACASAQACLAACEAADARCRSACAESARTGFDELLARVVACRVNVCARECPAGCGNAAPSSAECASCVVGSCCDEELACNGSPACTTRRWRREQCTDRACRDTADRRNLDDAGADERLESCRKNKCVGACTAWGCVSAPRESAADVSLTIAVQDSLFLFGSPPPPLEVKLCRRMDTACAAPLRKTKTDLGGFARLDIPTDANGFDGYLELLDPADRRIPTLVFIEPSARGARAIQVPSFTRETRAQIAQALGVFTDPLASGVIVVRPLDCAGQEGAGARFSIDADPPEITPFYLDRRLPAVATPTSSTDGDLAAGGFIGVPQGTPTLRARWTANGRELFAASILVRAGAISYVGYDASAFR